MSRGDTGKCEDVLRGLFLVGQISQKVQCFETALQTASMHGRITTRLAAMIPTSISTIAIVKGVIEVPGRR